MTRREQLRREGAKRVTERELWFYTALIVGTCGRGLWAIILATIFMLLWWWTS